MKKSSNPSLKKRSPDKSLKSIKTKLAINSIKKKLLYLAEYRPGAERVNMMLNKVFNVNTSLQF